MWLWVILTSWQEFLLFRMIVVCKIGVDAVEVVFIHTLCKLHRTCMAKFPIPFTLSAIAATDTNAGATGQTIKKSLKALTRLFQIFLSGYFY